METPLQRFLISLGVFVTMVLICLPGLWSCSPPSARMSR